MHVLYMNPVKIKLNPEFSGSLSAFGYRMNDDHSTRRDALSNAMTFWGSTYVIRKLNVLYIYNKYKYPEHAEIFRSDRDWIRKIRNSLDPNARRRNKAKHSMKKKNEWLVAKEFLKPKGT